MSARPVQPRLHLHRGTLLAAAVWFDPSLLGEREARRRVLAMWAPGMSVFELAGGFLVRLPRARSVDCSATPGLPLTLEDGVFLSAPLSEGERARLAPPQGATVLVRAGRAEVFPGNLLRRVEVAAWLDVSEWSVVSVKGLGVPPPAVAVLEPREAPKRSAFGNVPPLAPEAEEMRARMEGRPVPSGLQPVQPASWWKRLVAWLRGERGTPASGATEAQAATAPTAAEAPSALGRLVSWIRRALAPRAPATPAQPALPSGKGSPQQGNGATRPAEPSALSRLFDWLRRALSSSDAASGQPGPTQPPPAPEADKPGLFSRLTEWMLRNTPLGSMIGQRKAEYMRRLFDMFEQGNLQEALRYALPLGGEKSEATSISLGTPGPRESLDIQPRRGGAASVFGGGPEVYEALREHYRAAFRRLEREGRIDEAAFVLTELLGAHEEAVSFLEKHERPRLAAELAEGRGLAPGLVVRQWLLAKDLQRAVSIARRSGAFPDAVMRLERTHPNEARTLRLLWAETLAEAGDYLRAAVVVWPLEDARPLARRWLEHGAAVGGVGGARALARLVAAFPDAFPEARAPALELLDDESPARAAERLAFGEVLAAEPRSDSQVALAGPAVRALLRDRAAGHSRIDANLLARLLRDGGDGTLRADLPPVSDPRRRHWAEDPKAAPLVETIAAAEAGPYPIHDAVALSGQRLLLALGEGGVRLVRADGSSVAYFDVPAFWLVPSVHEDRVLALAPRGELKRISVIEPGPRRTVHWCDAKVDAFAPSFDGNLWFIAQDDTVMAVDALNLKDFRALWRVTQVGGVVTELKADAEWLRFVTRGDEAQVWTYALPGGPTLRSRAAPRAEDGLPPWVLNPKTGKAEPVESFLSSPPWSVLIERTESGYHVHLSSTGNIVRAWFTFEGEARVRARFSGSELLLFDTAGRLLRMDLEEGAARRVLVR
jgi:hypothetical protein